MDSKLIPVAVYGTLKKGGLLCQPQHIICSSKDKVKARLYNIPYGGYFPFPGIKLDEEGDLIDVEVQIVTEGYFNHMRMVEGSLYEVKEVITEGGVPCYIFEFVRDLDEDLRISEWNN